MSALSRLGIGDNAIPVEEFVTSLCEVFRLMDIDKVFYILEEKEEGLTSNFLQKAKDKLYLAEQITPEAYVLLTLQDDLLPVIKNRLPKISNKKQLVLSMNEFIKSARKVRKKVDNIYKTELDDASIADEIEAVLIRENLDDKLVAALELMLY